MRNLERVYPDYGSPWDMVLTEFVKNKFNLTMTSNSQAAKFLNLVN